MAVGNRSAHLGGVVGATLRKELRQIWRDGRMRSLAAIVVALAVAALVFGAQAAARVQDERSAAQQAVDAQWRDQGDKNPHVAAHFGTWVFAPVSAATAIDPGVTAFVGQAVKVEAHRRNFASDASARDAVGLGLAPFSVASVLLLLVPLLVIALGYGTWARERERGTLRQVLSTGAPRASLALGKALALGAATLGLLLPAAVLVVGVLWAQTGGNGGTGARLAALGLAYAAYFAVFGGLSMWVSSLARSSQGALVILVALWGLFCLGVPRIGAEAAAQLAPLPSRAVFAEAVGTSLEHGIDGKTPREKGVEKLTEQMLQAQGMSGMGMLVAASQVAGVELQAEAAWEDRVFDHHAAELQRLERRQERLSGWFALASPFVAMRSLSAALCGTDRAHHVHFTTQVEAFRKTLVGMLNKAFAKKGGSAGWRYKAGKELWKKAPPFQYVQPSAVEVLAGQGQAIACLAIWLVLAFSGALWGAFRVRVQ